MVVGIGCDLIEIKRIEKAIQRESFLRHTFTEREQEAARERASFYADNFAVKEAVSKCFGTGFHGMGLLDIEVLRDELGKPYVNLYGKALEMANNMGKVSVFVTITNTAELSMACAVIEKQ